MTSTTEHESHDEIAAAVNEISTFLAHEQIRDATSLDKCLVPDSNGGTQVDVITFCASAILYTADIVFASVNEVKRKRGKSSRDMMIMSSVEFLHLKRYTKVTGHG